MVRKLFSMLLVVGVVAAPAAVLAADKPDSPMNVDGANTVSTEQAKALFDKEILFLDVRSDADWEAGRIPGAEHLELKKVYSKDTLAELVKPDEEVVIYCNGPKCLRSSDACKKAVEWGWKKVHYFRDGFPAWKGAGLPVE